MGCCSGNEVIKHEVISDIKEKEKKILTEEDYLSLIQDNIYRVQEIMSLYNKTDDIDIEEEDSIDTTDSNHPKKKYFRFYIIFQLTLGKLRTLIEEHLSFKSNKKSYRKESDYIDFSNKVFDIALAKHYLDCLLNAEVTHNRKEVQKLDKDMVKNIFIDEINLNI